MDYNEVRDKNTLVVYLSAATLCSSSVCPFILLPPVPISHSISNLFFAISPAPKPASEVTMAISHRKKTFINGQNGKLLTKLGKGGQEIPDLPEGGGDKGTEKVIGDKPKEEVKKDLSLDKLSSEEQEQLKSLMAKLNE